jgi:hypothetical protein
VDARTILIWLLRAAWASLPFVAGPVLGDALDGADAAARLLATATLWLVWVTVLTATLAPRPLGLTLLRVVAPATPVATILATAVAGLDPAAAAAVVVSMVAGLVALSPEIGYVFVNGAAYPNERRHLLRAPGAVLAGPVLLAWVLLLAGVGTGPWLLAHGTWIAGGVALAVGAPVAWVMARALHGLTARWVVFVPAGLVLHDHLALADPVLFRKRIIARLGPAPADTEALDLTQRAPGLALELDLTESVNVVVVKPGRTPDEPGKTALLMFTPTRPGQVMADAREWRIRTG